MREDPELDNWMNNVLFSQIRMYSIYPRPESELDEELFTRLVELDGLRRRSRMREHQIYWKGSDPDRCFHNSFNFDLILKL